MSNQELGKEANKISKDRLFYSLGIFKYLMPYKIYFIIGMIALVLSSASVMILPKLIGGLVDVSTGKSFYDIKNRNTLGLFFIIVFITQGVLSFLRIYLFAKANEPALANIRQDLYDKIISMPIPFFEERRIGDLTSRITNDVAALQDVLSLTLAETFRQISVLIIGIAMLFFTSVKLTMVMLMSIPIVVLIAVIFGKFIQKNSRLTQEALAEANVIAEETFQSISMVKAYTSENYESNRYKKKIENTLRLALKNSLYRGTFVSFIIVATFGSIMFVLWYGSGLVEQYQSNSSQGMSEGNLVSFLIVTVFIGAALGGLSDAFGRILKALGSSERILDMINDKTETDANEYQSKVLNGDIVFKDISFAYPSRKDILIFDALNLEINQGKKIALVGASGAGKSTIFNLLLRFYQPDSGNVYINNVSINDITVKELRGNIAIVPQEVILFGGTIRENILYGKKDATETELLEAAKKANAWQFIKNFPEGLDTIVGERGVKLSGGQKQRIAIARAILKDPAILLLDEATSALDAESEVLVQDALNNLMENRTTIIIAHRLSTIRNVDTIYVLDKGKIVEHGTHSELSQLESGMYNNLLKLQYQLT
ncbi:MAG: ATP-binding cassette domain-containing protein [Sphingobacteriales bacterium]|jgi:ABC-type multidrug transport system fused ATPase/permease subunit|nr:MAG: ATP-binding cassette domain-containing protein [Sphingobacteriales bacterium]